MKKLFPILLFLICGCTYNHTPMPAIRNAYFENVYFSCFIQEEGKPQPYPAKILKDDNSDSAPHDGPDGVACGMGCELFLFPLELRNPAPPLKIWVFQDKARKCLLYSYTKEELMELKKEAGIPINYTAAFLLEKTGIRVISEKEYRKLKPTLKPHRYDPALCKPQADLAEYAAYYEKTGTKSSTTGKDIFETVDFLMNITLFAVGH